MRRESMECDEEDEQEYHGDCLDDWTESVIGKKKKKRESQPSYLRGEGEGKEVDEQVGQVGEYEEDNDAQWRQDIVGENDLSIILPELSFSTKKEVLKISLMYIVQEKRKVFCKTQVVEADAHEKW
jgi:hypothetical protein